MIFLAFARVLMSFFLCFMSPLSEADVNNDVANEMRKKEVCEKGFFNA